MTNEKETEATKVQTPEEAAKIIMDKIHQEFLKTPAGYIWTEIKDKPMEMFSLPSKTVAAHYKPTQVEPSKLYLVALNSVGSALPALEVAIGRGFDIDQVDKYITISRRL